MTNTLSNIRKPIEAELKQFEKYFNSLLDSDVPLLDTLLQYIFQKRGKQLRPILVFLSAALNGKICEKTHITASLIEMIHTASLVHDDVVDGASSRRNSLTINAMWNSKVAVLLGDYMLAQGLSTSVKNGCCDILQIITEAVQIMTKGEIAQFQRTIKSTLNEQEYLDIIYGKTASLFEACTAAGTLSVTEDEGKIAAMKELGYNIGMAFQIRDDVLDFSPDSTLMGKGIFNDIYEETITLPLIYSLRKAPYAKRKSILALIKNEKKSDNDINTIVDFIKIYNGFEYSQSKIDYFCSNATKIVDSYPHSNYTDSLRALINFTKEREM